MRDGVVESVSVQAAAEDVVCEVCSRKFRVTICRIKKKIDVAQIQLNLVYRLHFR